MKERKKEQGCNKRKGILKKSNLHERDSMGSFAQLFLGHTGNFTSSGQQDIFF